MSVRQIRLAIFFLITCSSAKSEGLFSAVSGKDINQFEFMQKHGLNAGGWLAVGATYATDNQANHNNSPISFNDQSNKVLLNQANVFAERLVDMDANEWNVGGRIDALFGTDSRFTQATGLDDKLISERDLGHYDLAIPQAYMEVFIPFDKGITAKIGHFYTVIGHEVVTAPNNFFYSHSYAMQYGEPFTHSGVLFSYAVNNNFTVNSGAVTGWDNFDKHLANWNFLGDLSWTNDEASSAVSWSVISGDVSNRVASSNRTLSSLVISQSLGDKLQYVFQNDIGYQRQAINSANDVFWYGINQYLFYDVTDTVSAGIRGEWFRDNNGTRLNIGSPGDYYAITAGVNWKAVSWLTLRPELRYDWAHSKTKAYNNHTQNNQLELAVDMVVTF